MPETDLETDAAPDAAPDAATELSRLTKIQLIIAGWVNDSLYNSPLSRSTEAWNHLSSQLPSLASALDKEL